MIFTKIDMQTWDRAERFNHFFSNVPCDYNITANVDITKLLQLTKAKSIKLYPTLIYILSRAVNEIKEMRIGFNEQNELGYYDICHPSYTITNSIEDSFSGIWTYSADNFADFYGECLKDIAEYSRATSYAPKSNQPCNTFYVSVTPQVAFTSLDLHLYNGSTNLTPIFTWGKYSNNSDGVTIPLSAHFHHAVCDGYQVGKFYSLVQTMADEVDNWLQY